MRGYHPIERHCHKCGAEPGQPCIGKRGPRLSFHQSRGGRSGIQAITAHRLEVESPIEDLLTANVLGWLAHYDIHGIDVATQVPVGPYRADMLITDGDRRLVVECDGATFHNNPNAIAHDKRRDRYFTIRGIAIMRFTGAEIKRDPRGCAAEIGLWIMSR